MDFGMYIFNTWARRCVYFEQMSLLDGFWMIKQGWNVYFVVEVPPLYFELMAILDGISMYLVGLECIF